MGRSRQYNKITDPESIAQINPENMALIEDFAIYLQSVDRSPQTIDHYKSDLQIFFVYNLQQNGNKRFTEITKREFVRFQNHALNVWRWSPNRIRVVKSALSSLSNYIENILDEEEGFQGFRSIIQRIESPAKEATLEKSVFTPEEMQALLDHLTRAKEYRKAAALALAMYSGRRKAELVQFKVSHFTPENVVFDTFWKTDETIRTKGRGVKGKQINLYVLKDKFEPYLNRWLRERQRKGITSEWLLTTERHPFRQLSPETMNGWAREFSEFLGRPFYWHSMRHYFTTMLARDEVPESVIQDIIAWESADMVKLYTDISKDENIGRYFNKQKFRIIKGA